jgi:hypothetical protein
MYSRDEGNVSMGLNVGLADWRFQTSKHLIECDVSTIYIAKYIFSWKHNGFGI